MGDDGRFSLPVAESTKLNSSGNRWGASPFSSSKQRSNSSINLINLDSSNVVSKIEPRVFADVQSKGLTSRIVKYHENESRLNRSMSTNCLFSKPGQFPIVTLQKTELPFRATKQNVSMTRIAPPDKSVFCGNTLSGLLRSNSVVGLQKSDEDISRENRPIIHPPPTESDMAPTRSVLDVLKEISRKRINSDDLDTLDTTKKNRVGNDVTDSGTNLTNISAPSTSFKRQRDINVQNKVDLNSNFKNQDCNKSPEQIKKRVCSYNNDITSSLSSSAKRKPNEIKRTSCQLNQTLPAYLEPYETPKLKMQKRHDHTVLEKNSSKECEANASGRIVIPANVLSQAVAYGCVPQRSQSEGCAPTATYQIAPKPRLTLFNKNYDIGNEKISSDLENDDNLDESSECSGINFVKPKKLTSASSGLKNPIIERTQKSKLALMLSGLRGELYQDNDEVDSSKKIEAVEGIGQTVPQKTTITPKTNGSLLNNISGTSTATNPNSTPKTTSPLVGLKITSKTISQPSTLTQNVEQNKESGVPTLGNIPEINKIPALSSTSTSSTLNTFGITTSVQTGKCEIKPSTQVSLKTGLTSAETNTTTMTSVTPILNSSNAKEIADNTNTNKSISLNTPPETLKLASNSSLSTASASSAPFSFGLPSGPMSKPSSTANEKMSFNSSVVSTSNVQSSTSNAFSFSNATNANKNVASSSENKNAGPPLPVLSSTSNIFTSSETTNKPSLSFGTTTATNNNSNSLLSQSKSNENTEKGDGSKSVGGFSFGMQMCKPLSTGAFTFGSTDCSSGTTNNVASSTTTPVAPSKNFTFSSSIASDQKTTTNVFGASSSSNSTSGGFAFGSSTNNSDKTNISSAFTFGSKSEPSPTNQKSTTPLNAGGFSFSSSTNKSATMGNITENKPFSFGTVQSSNTNPLIAASNNNSNQTSTNIFGSGTGSSFSFTASPHSNAPSPATNAHSSTFNFGTSSPSTNNLPSASTSNGNITSAAFSFGSASSTTAGNTSTIAKESTSTFTFGTTPTNTQPTAINTANGTKPVFNFGGSSLSTSNNAQSMGTLGSKPTFNFGASPSTNVQSTESPSLSASSGSTAAFNFGATSPTNIQATTAPSVTSNIFAIPQNASTGSTDRPIRRATRRLQK
ncbi:uncharacterized protein isoform X2 [Musca autumnalis]|uniref:uncharacterized protein isoform X2 n=1 Tax=Musca autumnalis TaxID=221902 RepID=UPI003CF35C33